MRFKLLEGKHVGFAPGYVKNDNGKWVKRTEPNGQEFERPPELTYGQGEPGGIIVEDTQDLVKLLGDKKFAYAPGSEPNKDDPEHPLGEIAPKSLGTAVSVAPSGQVTESLQVSTTTPDGRTISGAMTEASVPKTRAEKNERDTEAAKADADADDVPRGKTIRTGQGLHHVGEDLPSGPVATMPTPHGKGPTHKPAPQPAPRPTIQRPTPKPGDKTEGPSSRSSDD